jgi:hypothetical protein
MKLIEAKFSTLRFLCDLNLQRRENPELFPTHFPEDLFAAVANLISKRIRSTHTLTGWKEGVQGITLHTSSGLKRSAYRFGQWVRVTDSRTHADRWYRIDA